MDDGLVFAGGSTQADISRGQAKLFALTFDENLQMVDEIELRSNNPAAPSKWGVTCLRRFIDRDVLIAGVYQGVFVVEWTGTHFCILNIVEDLHSCKQAISHSGIINCIDMAENSVFTVSHKDSLINKIDFLRV